MKTTIITLASAFFASLLLASCSSTAGNVAAGAVAGVALKNAHDDKEKEERKEKKEKQEKKENKNKSR